MVGLVGALLLSFGLGPPPPPALPTIPAPAPAFSLAAVPPDAFAASTADPHLAGPYFGARYYRANTGRFTTVDPVYTWQENLVDPQRWNRYAYARNNPLKYNDPDGRVFKLAIYGYRIGRALYKGHDVYSTLSGIAEATGTIFSGDANVGTGDRLLATGSLLGEISGASDVYSAGKGVRKAFDPAPLKRGRDSEARVLDALGETKNTGKVTGCEGCSIPDYQNATTIGEIKNAARVDNTRQLRIQREAAEKSGREHVIQAGANTHVSRNVERGATRVERRPDLGPK